MLRFWVVRDSRSRKVRIGRVYTTSELIRKGVTWTDNYEIYRHRWDVFDVYAKEVSE